MLQLVLADFQRAVGRNPTDAAEVRDHVSTAQHAAAQLGSQLGAQPLSASGVASMPMLEALGADFAACHGRPASP